MGNNHPNDSERRMKPKLVSSLDAAIADIPDGARIMFGGFGGAGFPNNLIQALSKKGVKNITAISNNCGTREGELGVDVQARPGEARHLFIPRSDANNFRSGFARGKSRCELVPQGNCANACATRRQVYLGFYCTVGRAAPKSPWVGKEERAARRPKGAILETADSTPTMH